MDVQERQVNCKCRMHDRFLRGEQRRLAALAMSLPSGYLAVTARVAGGLTHLVEAVARVGVRQVRMNVVHGCPFGLLGWVRCRKRSRGARGRGLWLRDARRSPGSGGDGEEAADAPASH